MPAPDGGNLTDCAPFIKSGVDKMREIKMRLIAAITLCLALAGAGLAQTKPASDALQSKVDERLAGLVKANQFSGSVLVARAGQVLVSKGYGMANLEDETPNTPETKFRLGSITKQFT